MAAVQSNIQTNIVEKSPQMDRLRLSCQFLLNCFGSMHHLKMAKIICFVLKDVETFLLSLDSTSRMETFTNLPLIEMDDLGFLKKISSAELDYTIVTKDECLLLFIVCHLSFKGKSHLKDISTKVKKLAPKVLKMIFTHKGRKTFISNYSQYFQLSNQCYVELASTFLAVRDPTESPEPYKFPKCEENADLPHSFRKNVLHQNTVDTSPQITDRICKIVREGIVFLFEHFKCRLDRHLVCIVLHALDEAKCPFLLLPQPQQMSLVKKIIEPLWVARVEDNSGTFLRPSLETFELNKEQRNLLFVSYAVSQSEKLRPSTLMDMLEMHKMDVTEFEQIDEYFEYKKDFFSINDDDCIQFENFPPAKWMANLLSSETTFPSASIDQSEMANNIAMSFKDLSLGGTGISKELTTASNAVIEYNSEKSIEETVKGVNVYEYSKETLDYLIFRLHDGIAYLLQLFDLNIHSGLLEVVLHVKKDCAIFFDLPTPQQVEVIRVSYRDFYIDGHGTVVLDGLTKQQKIFRWSESEKKLLCMAYIINRQCLFLRTTMIHYRDIFRIYHTYNIENSEPLNDLDQFEYFKKREDFFRVSSNGFVGLGIVSHVKFNYISIVMSDRTPNSGFLNNGTGIPIVNFGPIVLNQVAIIPGLNYRPPIFNGSSFVPRLPWNPVGVNTGAAMPTLNFGATNCNAIGMMPDSNRCPILSSSVQVNKNKPVVSYKYTGKTKAKGKKRAFKNENLLANTESLTQNENVFTTEPVAKDETKIINVLDNMNEAKRVKYSVLHLSQCFALEADDLTLIMCVLGDVKSYLLKLTLQDRGDFVNNCVPYLFIGSSGSLSSTEPISGSCILSDEEKIALFAAILLSREQELHFANMFDKFPEYNTTDLACVKSSLDQYKFVTKWNHVFFMNPDGLVKLLPHLVKNSEVSSSGNASLNTKKSSHVNNGEIMDSKNRKGSEHTKDYDKSIGTNYAPVCEESLAVTVESVACSSTVSECGCVKDSTKELRAKNFFSIVLSPSKIGFSASVLKEKLLLASSEVQHYISCVYKGSIPRFLRNHEEFYISPTSGNVCCKR